MTKSKWHQLARRAAESADALRNQYDYDTELIDIPTSYTAGFLRWLLDEGSLEHRSLAASLLRKLPQPLTTFVGSVAAATSQLRNRSGATVSSVALRRCGAPDALPEFIRASTSGTLRELILPDDFLHDHASALCDASELTTLRLRGCVDTVAVDRLLRDHRGRLERLSLSVASTDLPATLRDLSLSELDISLKYHQSIEWLASCDWSTLRRLRIKLRDESIDICSFARFIERCSGLEELALHGLFVSLKPRDLAQLLSKTDGTRLRTLSVRNWNMPVSSIIEVCVRSGLDNLRHLDVGENACSGRSSSISRLEQLESLRADRCSMRDRSAYPLLQNVCKQQLREVDLTANLLDDSVRHAFLEYEWPSLRKLSVRENPLHEGTMSAILFSGTAPSLVELDMTATIQPALINAETALPPLRRLSLGATTITRETVTVLSRVVAESRLVAGDFSSCDLTEVTAGKLFEGAPLGQFLAVRLGGNSLSDLGFERIMQSGALDELIYLDIDDTQVTLPQLLSWIARVPSLSYCSILNIEPQGAQRSVTFADFVGRLEMLFTNRIDLTTLSLKRTRPSMRDWIEISSQAHRYH